MRKSTVFAIAIFTLFFSLAAPQAGQALAGDSFSAALNAHMPGLLAKYRVPGAVVSYIQDGAVTWTQAYGLANLATQAPMQPEMNFNFGSCGKVLTAWGVMRLVEQGKVDLDAPANRYLKRWQIPAGAYNPQKVTVRMLLSHTAGLTVSGFGDYSLRRSLPSLVDMLDGQNQMNGKVELFQEPGTGFSYSGGGYVLLQMIIEDVSGQPFAEFMQAEVTGPLGLSSLHWAWSPELMAAAPESYGPQQEALGFRQLASQAIGSEISTVPDFARFVAASVSGQQGEPAGRGVLSPASLAKMVTVQPGAVNEGLGYGISYTNANNGALLQHFGANTGWSAFFSIDTARREGLVLANNSGNGFPLNAAVQNLWLSILSGGGPAVYEPAPEPETIPLQGMIMLGLAGLLALALLIALLVFGFNLRRKQRGWSGRFNRSGLVWAGAWLLLALFWLYWFYTPLPLFFPPGFPDFWHTAQVDLVTAVLLAWLAFSAAAARAARKSK